LRPWPGERLRHPLPGSFRFQAAACPSSPLFRPRCFFRGFREVRPSVFPWALRKLAFNFPHSTEGPVVLSPCVLCQAQSTAPLWFRCASLRSPVMKHTQAFFSSPRNAQSFWAAAPGFAGVDFRAPPSRTKHPSKSPLSPPVVDKETLVGHPPTFPLRWASGGFWS